MSDTSISGDLTRPPMQATLPTLEIPAPPPAPQPLGIVSATMLADLNKAKALAWAHAADAVEVLAKIMVDTELYDTEVRVQAAAELLQFAAKGPY